MGAAGSRRIDCSNSLIEGWRNHLASGAPNPCLLRDRIDSGHFAEYTRRRMILSSLVLYKSRLDFPGFHGHLRVAVRIGEDQKGNRGETHHIRPQIQLPSA